MFFVQISNLWERGYSRWYLQGMPDTPQCLHREQARSHKGQMRPSQVECPAYFADLQPCHD